MNLRDGQDGSLEHALAQVTDTEVVFMTGLVFVVWLVMGAAQLGFTQGQASVPWIASYAACCAVAVFLAALGVKRRSAPRRWFLRTELVAVAFLSCLGFQGIVPGPRYDPAGPHASGQVLVVLVGVGRLPLRRSLVLIPASMTVAANLVMAALMPNFDALGMLEVVVLHLSVMIMSFFGNYRLEAPGRGVEQKESAREGAWLAVSPAPLPGGSPPIQQMGQAADVERPPNAASAWADVSDPNWRSERSVGSEQPILDESTSARQPAAPDGSEQPFLDESTSARQPAAPDGTSVQQRSPRPPRMPCRFAPRQGTTANSDSLGSGRPSGASLGSGRPSGASARSGRPSGASARSGRPSGASGVSVCTSSLWSADDYALKDDMKWLQTRPPREQLAILMRQHVHQDLAEQETIHRILKEQLRRLAHGCRCPPSSLNGLWILESTNGDTTNVAPWLQRLRIYGYLISDGNGVISYLESRGAEWYFEGGLLNSGSNVLTRLGRSGVHFVYSKFA